MNEIKSKTLRGKSLILESDDTHRMWIDVFSSGELVLHEAFGKSIQHPESVDDLGEQANSSYHVTMAIKRKYVSKLIEFFHIPDLFDFTDENSQALGELKDKPKEENAGTMD